MFNEWILKCTWSVWTPSGVSVNNCIYLKQMETICFSVCGTIERKMSLFQLSISNWNFLWLLPHSSILSVSYKCNVLIKHVQWNCWFYLFIVYVLFYNRRNLTIYYPFRKSRQSAWFSLYNRALDILCISLSPVFLGVYSLIHPNYCLESVAWDIFRNLVPPTTW